MSTMDPDSSTKNFACRQYSKESRKNCIDWGLHPIHLRKSSQKPNEISKNLISFNYHCPFKKMFINLIFGFFLVLLSIHRASCLEWEIQPNSLYPVLLDSSAVTIDCLARGVPSNDIVYEWFHNDKKVDVSKENHISIFVNQSLHISVSTIHTLGRYYCLASYKAKSVIRSSVAEVKLAANLGSPDLSPGILSLNEGESASFFCLSGESWPMAEIDWLIQGSEIVDGGAFSITTLSSGNPLKSTSTLIINTEGQLRLNGSKISCQSTNPLNRTLIQMSEEALLIIVEPEKDAKLVTAPPNRVDVPLGTAVDLPCRWDGNPVPQVNWVKNEGGHEFDVELSGLGKVTRDPDGLRRADLSIPSLTLAHVGEYFCRAAVSKAGVREVKKFSVNVDYTEFEFQFRTNPSDITGMAGRSTTLECESPVSRPPAVISWYKDDTAFDLIGAGNAWIMPGGALNFTKLKRSDAGTYNCVARNRFYPEVTRTSLDAVLTVESSPAIVTPPAPVSLVRHRVLHLECRVDGNPFPSVAWYKKLKAPLPGQKPDPIAPSYHVSFANANQSLVIPRLEYDDGGEYFCEASNKYGKTTSPFAKVFVVIPPQIEDGPSLLVTATKGDSVLIPCRVYGVPSPSVSWFKDGVVYVLRENMVPDKSMGIRVTNITEAEEGEYVCRAINSGGSRESNITVVVHVLPAAYTMLSNSRVVRGKPVSIHCHATGNPRPNVTWRFNGADVGGNSGPSNLHPEFVVLNESHTLSIPDTHPRHNGNYSCVATNVAGVAEAVAVLHVLVPPSIGSVDGPRLIPAGQNATLTCQLREGDPKPELTWRKDGAALESSNDRRLIVEGGVVVFNVAQKSDEGLYICRAENEEGEDTEKAEIVVQAIPVPPVAIDAQPVSTTSVNLTWTPSSQPRGNEVDFWSIEYKLTRAADFRRHPIKASATRDWQEVDGLLPGQEYTFRVSAGNAVGLSAFSNAVSGSPFDSAPGAPSNVRVVSVDKRSARLSWETPDESKGVIRYYQIDYRRKGDEVFVSKRINDPETPTQKFELKDLLSYKTYEFRVRGAAIKQDHVLWGEFTVLLNLTTLKDLPGAVPTGVTAVDTAPGVVQLTWIPIPVEFENGELGRYVVTYKRDGYPTSPDVSVPARTTVAVINDLKPWTNYQFWVLVENDVGKGNYSSVVVHRTPPSFPTGVVQNLAARGISPTAIEVSWEPVNPEQRNSIISGYIIDYAASNPTNYTEEQGFSESPGQLSYTVQGLEPFTEYRITVQALTKQLENGHGPKSDPIFVYTLSSPSSPVLDVSLTPNVYSIVVNWRPPLRPNGNILFYAVYVWTDDESSLLTDVRGPLISAEKVHTNATDVTLIGLKPDTRYTVCVEAENAAGQARECEHQSTTTLTAPTVAIVTTPLSTYGTNDVFPEDGATTAKPPVTLPPSSSFFQILNDHIYAVIVFIIFLFILLTILFGYFIRKCVISNRQKRRRRAKYLSAASLMQRHASQTRASPSMDDSASSASSTLNPRHAVPSYGGATTYYPTPPAVGVDGGSPVRVGGPMIPSSRSMSHGIPPVTNQEHRNPVFGVRNPRLANSAHQLPLGRGGIAGRAPLASHEGDAAFDNLAFDTDGVVAEAAQKALRRPSPPTPRTRMSRRRSLTLQDGTGASVYQHQQMTAPRPDGTTEPETVVTHRNRISRRAAAAIAADRNRLSAVDVLGLGARDTDYLVDSDIMVVYNERTAL